MISQSEVTTTWCSDMISTMSVRKKQAWKLSQTLSLEQVCKISLDFWHFLSYFPHQTTSSMGESSLRDFEGSHLYIQIVIVISIFYALLPLQVARQIVVRWYSGERGEGQLDWILIWFKCWQIKKPPIPGDHLASRPGRRPPQPGQHPHPE